MADKDRKKVKYLSKGVKFAGKQVTLYSLDGATWSTRKEELHQILERQEAERVSFNQLLGEAKAKEGQEAEAEVVDPVIEDEMLPIEDEPPAPPVKQKVAIKAAAKAKSSKPARKAAPAKKEKALATPKARVSSKPASTNKAAASKSKRKVA